MEENGSAAASTGGTAVENLRPKRKPYIHPQSLCDRAERLCRVHPQKAVAEILGIAEATLSRMKQRGFRANGGKRRRQRPGDFAIQCQHMSYRELARHYRAGEATVGRWGREIGRPPRWRGSVEQFVIPQRSLIAGIIGSSSTYEDAAYRLGVSPTTLRLWRRVREIAHLRPGQGDDRAVGWVERYVSEARA